LAVQNFTNGLSLMMSDSELLSIQYRTLFLTSRSGRIERENDPDHSSGPRLWLAGCRSGNVGGVRCDVGDGVAVEIAALLASEPPFVTRNSLPIHLDSYVELLSRGATAPTSNLGLIYQLPNGLQYESGATLITSNSDEGQRLQTSLSNHGMPDQLVKLGFHNASDLWLPWCMALTEDQLVSVAFAARLSQTGACLGVVTVPAFRGKGYAAAVTAQWSRLPSLRSRALFYSTDQSNTSSQRVVARLGLRFLGASLRLT
jgi:hypothetical protein